MKSLYCILLLVLISFICLLSPNKIFGVIEITYSTPSASIISDQELTLDVTLSGATETAEYYLKGVFYQPGTTTYFGFTKNHIGVWNESGTSPQQHFKIQGNQTVSMTFKPDLAHTGFMGSGQYHFKVGRYTATGTSATWPLQEPASIHINHPTAVPSPTTSPLPSNTATPQPINNITLSEIFACPLSEATEWVELFNDNDYQVTLTDWSLRDNTTTNKKQFTTTIAAKGYSVIEMQSLFNNSGDSVRLFNAQQQEVAQTQYELCNPQTSFIFHDQQWVETISITKGSANQLQKLEEKSSTLSTSSPLPRDSTRPFPSSTTKVTSLLDTEKLITNHDFASSSATIAGLILGQTIDEQQATNEGEILDHPTQLQTINKTSVWASLMLGCGFLLLSLSVYGGFQWYNSL